MFLTSKEDLIKDVEYCPFCNRDSDIAIIHPKPDKFHPPTDIGNWCLEFWNSLKLGSIKYKKIEDSTGNIRDTVSFNFVTGQTFDNDPKHHTRAGFDYCPYCHASIL
jgi:hypothetical protein